MGKGSIAALWAVCLAIANAASAAPAAPHWVGSWSAAQMSLASRDALPAGTLDGATVRQVVHLSIGGSAIRVHLSNLSGIAPLHIAAAHVARPLAPGGAAIDPASDRMLTFNGASDVVVPAGADYISDPLTYPVPPGADLAVSLYFDAQPEQQTGHPASRATSYIAHGNLISAPDLPDATPVEHWFFLAGVDVMAPPDAFAIAALGDSITDGHGATTNGNDRWPDDLARALRKGLPQEQVGILNEGIGGNRLLLDGVGPGALARFDHDVLGHGGVRYVIVLEGINDIGTFDRAGIRSKADHDALVRQMTGALSQIVARAHAAGLTAYGATITPFMDCNAYMPKPISEADRVAVNDWIRAPGHFDAVIDWDRAVRDPARPDHLAAPYDSGDHLHPSAMGYQAMADAIPLSLFAR